MLILMLILLYFLKFSNGLEASGVVTPSGMSSKIGTSSDASSGAVTSSIPHGTSSEAPTSSALTYSEVMRSSEANSGASKDSELLPTSSGKTSEVVTSSEIAFGASTSSYPSQTFSERGTSFEASSGSLTSPGKSSEVSSSKVKRSPGALTSSESGKSSEKPLGSSTSSVPHGKSSKPPFKSATSSESLPTPSKSTSRPPTSSNLSKTSSESRTPAGASSGSLTSSELRSSKVKRSPEELTSSEKAAGSFTSSIPHGTSSKPSFKSPTSSETSSTSSNGLTASKTNSGSVTSSEPLPTSSKSTSGASDSPTSSESPSSTSSESPECLLECPDGYITGKSSCFIIYSPPSNSYQSALSLCMSHPRRTLASLEKIREDVAILQAKSSESINVNWMFSNGIGSRRERFEKKADVYSIFDQTLVLAPIAVTVGISEKFTNISTLCILPKYCDPPICDVEQLLLTYDYNLLFSSSTKSLKPKETASLTCNPTKKSFQITCGSLGNIYPDPSMIDCKRTNFEGSWNLNGTKELVSSCSKGFSRGVERCDPVLDPSGSILGYRLTCKPGWTQSTCWYTPDTCTSNYCGPKGKCISEVGERRCECDYGYSGDRCQWNLREKYSKVWTFPVFTGAIITLGGFLVRMVKRGVALGRMDTVEADEDDPQSTHQTFRSYCMFVAGILVMFSSNPSLTDITPTACRFNFIAVHFCFLLAMVQWLLEAWNVNQILRCVHLNHWETDWNGEKAWGVRIVPRMFFSILVVAGALLITFQAGWNQLAAPWTCVGVIRQGTVSVWIPIFGMVVCVCLWAGAICECSLLIKFRRPLLGYRLDLKIERELGHEEGRRVEKCRRNEVLCMVGLLLLVVLWLLTILSADYKDDVSIGSLTVLMSLTYSLFSFYQETQTCPEDRAMWITLLQRYLPLRFAPSYNPETMWTTEEVREMYQFSPQERKIRYQDFISRNQFLHLHHRWDLRFNEILAENTMTINEALVKVFCEEMKRLKENNGTIRQKQYIQDAYRDFLSSIPDIDPRTDKGRIQGRLELVTLAAEAPIGVKLAKFFIVPGFDIFEPEITENGETENRNERQRRRLRNERIQMNHYRIMREAAHSQTVFINSSIHFHYFGNEVVR